MKKKYHFTKTKYLVINNLRFQFSTFNFQLFLNYRPSNMRFIYEKTLQEYMIVDEDIQIACMSLFF